MPEKKETRGKSYVHNVTKQENFKELHETAVKDFNASCEKLLEADPEEFKRLVIEKLEFLHEEMIETGIVWNRDQREIMVEVTAETFQRHNGLFKETAERIHTLEEVLFMVACVVVPHVTGKPIDKSEFGKRLNVDFPKDPSEAMEKYWGISGDGADQEAEA